MALIVLLAPTAAGAALLAEPDASAVRQLVLLRDRKGRLWMATYVLERQTAAGWRISGCVVAVDSGKSST